MSPLSPAESEGWGPQAAPLPGGVDRVPAAAHAQPPAAAPGQSAALPDQLQFHEPNAASPQHPGSHPTFVSGCFGGRLIPAPPRRPADRHQVSRGRRRVGGGGLETPVHDLGNTDIMTPPTGCKGGGGTCLRRSHSSAGWAVINVPQHNINQVHCGLPSFHH